MEPVKRISWPELVATIRDEVRQVVREELANKDRPALLTVEELASRLNASPKWIYPRVHRAKNPIPHRKVDGLIRFDWEEVSRWMSDGK